MFIKHTKTHIKPIICAWIIQKAARNHTKSSTNHIKHIKTGIKPYIFAWNIQKAAKKHPKSSGDGLQPGPRQQSSWAETIIKTTGTLRIAFGNLILTRTRKLCYMYIFSYVLSKDWSSDLINPARPAGLTALSVGRSDCINGVFCSKSLLILLFLMKDVYIFVSVWMH